MDKIINLKQCSLLLGIHTSTARNWCNKGIIPCYRVGPRRDRHFKESDIIQYREASREKARAV